MLDTMMIPILAVGFVLQFKEQMKEVDGVELSCPRSAAKHGGYTQLTLRGVPAAVAQAKKAVAELVAEKGQRAAAASERRLDITDGKMYTKTSFFKFYGKDAGRARWDRAAWFAKVGSRAASVEWCQTKAGYKLTAEQNVISAGAAAAAVAPPTSPAVSAKSNGFGLLAVDEPEPPATVCTSHSWAGPMDLVAEEDPQPMNAKERRRQRRQAPASAAVSG